MKTTLLSLTAFVASVAAHGAVTSYVIDGVTYPGYQGFSPSPSYAGIQLQWPDYNPSTASAASARCNGGTSAPSFASVKPGSTVRALWAQWTHSPSTYAVYLYPCASFPCSTTGSSWFKIDEVGVLGATVGSDNWAGDVIMKTGGYTSTIPANLKAGKYVIRHELVARHQANNPQFYAECAQIEVTGSGSAFPDSSYQVAIPSTAYANPSDPMLNFEVNGSTQPASYYKIHGPPVFGKGGSTSQPPVTQPSGGVTTTRPAEVYTTTTRQQQQATTTRQQQQPTTTAAPTGGAPLYGQCGGKNWTGAKTCAQGTCKVSGEYYSQCLN